MRVGLVGQFGYRNFGNEASLDAALSLLRDHGGTDPVVLTDAPDVARRERGLPAWPLSSPSAPRGGWRGALGKFADLRQAWRVVGRLDAVLVPGTGILEGHAVHPWGPPFTLACYGIVARLRRRPFVLLSVGADGLGGPVTRALLRVVLRTATSVTTRDEGSADVVADSGAPRPRVVPDLAFALPLPSPDEAVSERPRVAVGVVRFDWCAPAEGQDEYLSRTARLVRSVVAQGMDVVLVGGDAADAPTARAVEEVVADPTHVVLASAESFAGLERVLRGSRAMVAVRYHNLVAAVRCGIPAVSLGYGPKQRWLLQRFGDPLRAHAVDDFDPELVARQVVAAAAATDAPDESSGRALQEARSELATQARQVARLLGLSPVLPATTAHSATTAEPLGGRVLGEVVP
ncbi:polysaccharide pyruvyl transferase family protein [Isoptericola sp. NPDC057653]|uniref:polysaccharide pyruvyl transferase family protein n=1 Tax=Isoptericola sp. NPDC057653 TaxID=3346195 RepID=UPI00368214DD